MEEFRDIEIDFEVSKRIELERKSFSETPNAVLRRLLGIDPMFHDHPSPSRAPLRHWAGKGVTLPHGTQVRMEYNGRVHTGVVENGVWLVEGGEHNSPSAAAGSVAITKSGSRTSLDGWLYWQVKRPSDSSWLRLSELRSQPNAKREETQEAKEMSTYQASGFDLPTESRVIDALEDFLAKRSRPATPTEAYRALGDFFQLSIEQRNRMMPNTDEIHWENRVRQARRKLVNAGKLALHLPRGLWALNLTTKNND